MVSRYPNFFTFFCHILKKKSSEKLLRLNIYKFFSYRDLTWQKPLNNGGSALTQYRVERKCITTKKDWETIIETNANTYTHTDTKNIVYKHKYQYRVFCSNKAGESPPGGPTPIVAARKRKCKFLNLNLHIYFEMIS